MGSLVDLTFELDKHVEYASARRYFLEIYLFIIKFIYFIYYNILRVTQCRALLNYTESVSHQFCVYGDVISSGRSKAISILFVAQTVVSVEMINKNAKNFAKNLPSGNHFFFFSIIFLWSMLPTLPRYRKFHCIKNYGSWWCNYY